MNRRAEEFAKAQAEAEDRDRRVARYIELRLHTSLPQDVRRRMTRFA